MELTDYLKLKYPKLLQEKRKVIALVQSVIRGHKLDQLTQLEDTTDQSDYMLIPKSKETNFYNNPKKFVLDHELDERVDYPPLMKECIKKSKSFSALYSDDLKYNVPRKREQDYLQNLFGYDKIGLRVVKKQQIELE